MPSAAAILYYLSHPNELRDMIQWKVWHNPVHERNLEEEPESLRICFDFLDKTSRSFSAVIKELNPELLVPVTIFYLILRALDTIEDDMTIPLNTKEPNLRNFYTILEKDGWTFDGCSPTEKDRIVLERFDYVITEFKKIKPEYRAILMDITKTMGQGMADNAVKVEKNGGISVESVADYEEYCHYVAGVVGEGCTRLFVGGGLANPVLLKGRQDLYESMGQFLQQTNVIRDIREDFEDKRQFWPKAVWSKHVSDFSDLFKPDHRDAALRCSSEMILIALQRAPDCMFYMAGIKDQSVFNFAAIPQAMAISTLELCFRNPALFERNIKITRGQACGVMMNSSQNLPILYEVFKKFARKIHKKNDPTDPNFLEISIACARIEQFIEEIFPSQRPTSLVRAPGSGAVISRNETPEQQAQREAADAQTKKEIMYLGLVVGATVIFMCLLMLWIAWMMGARYDLAWKGIRPGDPGSSVYEKMQEQAAKEAAKESFVGHAHREL